MCYFSSLFAAVQFVAVPFVVVVVADLQVVAAYFQADVDQASCLADQGAQVSSAGHAHLSVSRGPLSGSVGFGKR